MKAGRVVSLRGMQEFDGVGIAEVVAFTNASPDRTRAWKVHDARIWVQGNESTSAPVNKYGSEYVISMQLQTDHKRIIPTLEAEDNRCFGWVRNLVRVSSGNGGVVNGQLSAMTVIDPDHLITDQLIQQFAFSADDIGENARVNICWLVLLEQVKITPVESILQSVKGRSQDLEN